MSRFTLGKKASAGSSKSWRIRRTDELDAIVHSVLHDDESLSDFVRKLIEQEVSKRLTIKKGNGKK